MPQYSNKGLVIDGFQGVLAPGICTDDSQEDFANSEHSGRWNVGSFTLRWSIKDISAPPMSFIPNSTQDHLIFQMPTSPNWGLHIVDGIIQSKIDVGSSPGGSYDLKLGTNESGTYNNIVLGGGSPTPTWPPTVKTHQTMDGIFGTSPGMGGRTNFRTYRDIYLRWTAAGFGTLNPSPVSLVLFGYLIPDATDSTS